MYKACKDCGVAGTPGDGLSNRGLCIDCALRRHAAAARQMAEKRGPQFEQWQQSMIDLAAQFMRDQQVSA